MSAPFRELFVELPATVFETLRGIGEQAVRQATTARKPPPPPPWWTSVRLGPILAEHWSCYYVERAREATRAVVVFRVQLWCRHGVRFEVRERALAIAVFDEAFDLIDREFQLAERRCLCVDPNRRKAPMSVERDPVYGRAVATGRAHLRAALHGGVAELGQPRADRYSLG